MPQINAPQITFPSYSDNGVTFSVDIPSSDAGAVFSITTPSGEQIALVPDQIKLISRFGTALLGQASTTLDEVRFTQHHPMLDTDLAPKVQERLSGSRDLPRILWANNVPVRTDGTPMMVWERDRENGASFWRLTLHGADTVTVSTAAWDDAAGIAAMVNQLHDPDTVLIMAGMVNPEPVARMTARQNVAELRGSRAIPTTNLQKVRAVLTEAGLNCPEHESTYYKARLRILKVPSSIGDIAVAVAIAPPRSHPRFFQSLSGEEQQLPYQEQRRLNEERMQAAQQAWLAAAVPLLVAKGFRQVSLPDPRARWGVSTGVIWFTRMGAEDWSSVQAAAEAAADGLEMNRGSSL